MYGVYVSTFINYSTSKKLFRQSPKTETYFFLKPLILSAIFHIDNILSHDKLKKHLELEFEVNKNRQIYWDDVAMFCHADEYELGIRPMD